MTLKEMTGILVLITFAFWVIWDIYAIWFGGFQVSISAIITGFSWYSPAWPFVIGGLCGHWFWPAKRRD